MVSLVVPATAVTIFLSSPSKAFVNEDFPTFGLPTIATLGIVISSKPFSSFGNILTNASNKSPVPLPLIAEIG